MAIVWPVSSNLKRIRRRERILKVLVIPHNQDLDNHETGLRKKREGTAIDNAPESLIDDDLQDIT